MDIPELAFPQGITLENCTMEQYRQALEHVVSPFGARAEITYDDQDYPHPTILSRVGVSDTLYADITGNLWTYENNQFSHRRKPTQSFAKYNAELHSSAVNLANSIQQEVAPDDELALILDPSLGDEPEPPVKTIKGRFRDQTYTLTPIGNSTTQYCDEKHELWIRQGDDIRLVNPWPDAPPRVSIPVVKTGDGPFEVYTAAPRLEPVTLAPVKNGIYTTREGTLVARLSDPGYDREKNEYTMVGFVATPERIWETLFDDEGNAYLPLYLLDNQSTPITPELIAKKEEAMGRIEDFERRDNVRTLEDSIRFLEAARNR